MTQLPHAATIDEKALLRTPGDWSRAFLAIYKPNVIYTAVLSVVPSSTDMVGQISFTGGSGTLADVKAEMTLWSGSAAGARDLGVCRIRRAPIAGTFYIGYTSEIDWAGAVTVYLTIVDHARLSKKPVLIDNGDILLDGEYTYTNQHVLFDPVPVLSCHAVGTLVSGTLAFVWDASNSWVFDSTIASYLWSAPGCLSISSAVSATPTITYNTAGNHPVYCTVTAANGKSATGIQFAFRFDAANKPHVVEVRAPSAEYDAGGWSFAVKMFADADPANVIEGALCVLFAEDYYGSTKQSLGQMANRENIICWGYISDKEKIDWDAESSSVEFSVQGPHAWLDKIEINPFVLSLATNTPDSWQVMPGLNVARALWSILHWYSNATALLNITLNTDARLAPKIESAEGSVWGQMNKIAWEKIFGRVGCDRYGRLWSVIDPQCVPVAERTWVSVMTLTKKDWRTPVEFERSPDRKLAMLSASGWVVDTTGSVTTLYALAMGHIGAQYGGSEIIDHLLAQDQVQFNELSGLYMGWKNNQLEFDFWLAQNNRMVDLWPNQFLDVSLAAGDTARGIAYAGNLIPRAITLQHDPDAGCWSTEIFCEAETFAELAVDGDIPVSTGIDDFDTSFPPLDDFPEMPDVPILDLPPSVENLNLPSRVVIASDDYGVMFSENVNNGDITKIIWKSMNAGLSEFERLQIGNLVVTPSGATYIMTNGDNFSGWQKIMVCETLGGTWRTVFDAATGYPAAGSSIFGLGVNPLKNDEIAIWGGRPWSWPSDGNIGTFQLGIGGSGGIVLSAGQNYPRQAASTVLFSNNGWTVYGNQGTGILGSFSSPAVTRFSAAGAPLTMFIIAGLGGGNPMRGCAVGSQDATFYWEYDVAYKMTVATTVSTPTTIHPGYGSRQGMASSPTGVYIMGNDAGTPKLSTDSGATFIGTALTIGPNVWENCRDNNRWLFGGGANIKITLDRGATDINLIGNLLYAAPLINIISIRFVE